LLCFTETRDYFIFFWTDKTTGCPLQKNERVPGLFLEGEAIGALRGTLTPSGAEVTEGIQLLHHQALVACSRVNVTFTKDKHDHQPGKKKYNLPHSHSDTSANE
jgi:hypothetical protein